MPYVDGRYRFREKGDTNQVVSPTVTKILEMKLKVEIGDSLTGHQKRNNWFFDNRINHGKSETGGKQERFMVDMMTWPGH